MTEKIGCRFNPPDHHFHVASFCSLFTLVSRYFWAFPKCGGGSTQHERDMER